jgi:predicted NBD/HSP70 family sugar kinase
LPARIDRDVPRFASLFSNGNPSPANGVDGGRHPAGWSMAANRSASPAGPHSNPDLPRVSVTSYNLEIEDSEGFVGDRASKGAFIALVDELRARLKEVGEDPLGDTPTEEIGRKRLDKLLTEGGSEVAGLIHGALEEFAQKLAGVIRRFIRLKGWREVERIVIGGGFRQSRLGELVIGRASVALKEQRIALDIRPIRHHPDEAGLIGCAHLAPTWMFSGHNSIVAVDIGGSNFRAGIVDLHLDEAEDLAAAKVWKSELWRHADDNPGRDEAVERLGGMITELIERAEKKQLKLAPFIGVGCPGIITADGFIERGAQNLPGNWESSRFHLADALIEMVPTIGGHDTVVLMHNDAVVQGLSDAPFMQDVANWAVLTIGTGLGNASFANKEK